MIGDELVGVVEAGDLEPDYGDRTQLAEAVRQVARQVSGPYYSTRAAAVAASGAAALPMTVTSINVGGFIVEGSGAARYKRAEAEPPHPGKFQDSDSQWWELSEAVISPLMLGAAMDGVTDDTAILQAMIDAYDEIYWPARACAVTTLEFRRAQARYYGQIYLNGIASVPTAAIVEFTTRNNTFQSIRINQKFNINYTAAWKWYSPSTVAPAEYIKVQEAYVQNALIGLLYGQINGDAVVDAPQSENSISHFHTRGVERPNNINQPNGFLLISTSTIAAQRHEWELEQPGAYSFEQACAVTIYKGRLQVTASEILKADTQLGIGMRILGGTLMVSNTSVEIAGKNLLIENGDVILDMIKSYFGNALHDYIEISAAAEGALVIDGMIVNKAAAGINANRGFIQHNDNTEYDVQITNVICRNFRGPQVFKGPTNGDYAPFNAMIKNLKVIDGEPTRPNILIPANGQDSNLLHSLGVDVAADTLDGWHLRLSYGAGTTIAVVADAASTSSKRKKLANAVEVVATGAASAQTIDPTDLTSIKATSLRVSEGTQILIGAYVRASTEGAQQSLGAVFYDVSGATRTFTEMVGTTVIDGTWRYYEGVVTAPAGAKFAGLTVDATTSTILVTGASLKILN